MTGIYKIESKIYPNKIYIGSAICISKRKREHLFQLKNNTHHNPKLQSHYNKYGKDDLIFIPIVGCSKENLIAYEQFYIDSLNPWFNCSPTAGNMLGIKRSPEACRNIGKAKIGHIPWNKGMKLSKEHCNKLRKSHEGQVPWNKGIKGFLKGKTISEDHKKRISEANKGVKNGMYGKSPSDESRKKKSESLKRAWKLRKLKLVS